MHNKHYGHLISIIQKQVYKKREVAQIICSNLFKSNISKNSGFILFGKLISTLWIHPFALTISKEKKTSLLKI